MLHAETNEGKKEEADILFTVGSLIRIALNKIGGERKSMLIWSIYGIYESVRTNRRLLMLRSDGMSTYRAHEFCAFTSTAIGFAVSRSFFFKEQSAGSLRVIMVCSSRRDHPTPCLVPL